MAKGMAMKTILAVDDEKLILKILAKRLSAYADEFRLLTAGHGEEAIDILSSNPVDLVITDLQMPVMDGFELITYLMHNFHTLPVVVLTGCKTEEIGSRLQGTVRCVNKSTIDFNAFVAELQSLLMSSTKGHIEGITLFSFLQLLHLERKTCSLTIKSSGRKGFLYFLGGELINAVYENIEGKFSAYEIVTWEDPKIEIDNICRSQNRVVTDSLDAILMDAFKMKDEEAREPQFEF